MGDFWHKRSKVNAEKYTENLRCFDMSNLYLQGEPDTDTEASIYIIAERNKAFELYLDQIEPTWRDQFVFKEVGLSGKMKEM